MRKRYRLGVRASICVIILLLPLIHVLNSLQLIGIVAALLWFIIGVETWGNAQHCHIWIGEKKRREYVCKYNIRCFQGEEKDIEENNSERISIEDGDINFGV